MIHIKKLPERQKDPETCCGSVKQNNKYINPVSVINITKKKYYC